MDYSVLVLFPSFEALRQLNTLCKRVGSMNNKHLNRIILVSGTHFFPVNVLSKQKRAMRRRMRKLRELKVGRYAACLVDLNDYLAALPGKKASDYIGEM